MLQSGSYQEPELEFDSDASFDSGMTSDGDGGEDGPASCDYSDEDGDAPDAPPPYGALMPGPGVLHGSPRLFDYSAGAQLPGGLLGTSAIATAPSQERDWTGFIAGMSTAAHTPAISAFAAAQAPSGGASPVTAGAPNLNPFAAQRKRSWALMQHQQGQPGTGQSEQPRHRELDALRRWSQDCARRHSAPYDGVDINAAAVAAAAALTRCVPSVSSTSLPPTQKPRSFSTDLRELSQLDCAARGFRPASLNSPSVVDIHRMAARLSGIMDATREDARPGGSETANPWGGTLGTVSLPPNLRPRDEGGDARRDLHRSSFSAEPRMQLAPPRGAAMQRPCTGDVRGSSDRGQPQGAAPMPAGPGLQDVTSQPANGGGSVIGLASRAASSTMPDDVDVPLATAWSWDGVDGATRSRLTSLQATATDGDRVQDTLQRLRPSMLMGKPPLGWQLGTRSNSDSTGAFCTPCSVCPVVQSVLTCVKFAKYVLARTAI